MIDQKGFELPPAEAVGSPMLCLFDGPYVIDCGRRMDVPEGSKRLLAFVALQGGRTTRRHAAGMLWPFGDDTRAAGNLRTALWRLKCAGISVLFADKSVLSVQANTIIDICVVNDWAGRLIDGSAKSDDLQVIKLHPEATNVLPGWYDDWVIFERERTRQRLLHAMEALSQQLIRRRRFGEAVEAAIQATSMEPLRESAQRALIEAHLAEGNVVEARRVYDSFCRLIRNELGIGPSLEIPGLFAVRPSSDFASRFSVP